MTPFIDVMLVLLIIFMVAAPLLTVGVPLDLPETAAKPLNVEQKPLMLSIDDKGRVFLMETPLEDSEIVPKLMAVAKAGAEERIYIRGARQVDYGRVAQIMALVTAAGFKRVALAPGESKTVTFELGFDDLAMYDLEMRPVVEPGTFTVFVGGSSDATLEGRFEVRR